jgi:hypothetical protein
MTAVRREVSGPERTTRVLLIATILAASYLGFFGYRAQGLTGELAWADRLRGLGPAPQQYRVAIVWLAHALAVHLHIKLRMAFASIDLLCSMIAVLVLLSVFEHTDAYRDASRLGRWFGAAVFVFLMNWFLGWLLWLQKPETLPAALFVALMLWLWQPGRQPSRQPTRPAARALALMFLTLLLATFRADIACLLNAGVLLFVLTQPGLPLSLPRSLARAVSFVGALSAGIVQLYLMFVAFPHANYGRTKVMQLVPNLVHATRWPPFVLFLLPLAWMTVQVVRRRYTRDAAGLAVLTGAALFGLLWFCIGEIDEVRVFLPFAFALAPLTAEMAILRAEQPGPPAAL